MSALEFLDTNMLVYSYDVSDAQAGIAQDLIDELLGGEFVISTQVLAEFASTLLHKMKPAANSRRSHGDT